MCLSMVFLQTVFLKVLQFSQKKTFAGVFLNNVAGLREKKRLQHRCFPVKIAKVLGTASFIKHLGDCFWVSKKIIIKHVEFKII